MTSPKVPAERFECFYCGQDVPYVPGGSDYPDAHRECYNVYLIEQDTLDDERRAMADRIYGGSDQDAQEETDGQDDSDEGEEL